MEFKNEELVEREIQIARLLVQGFGQREIAAHTGLQKNMITAHIRNMKVKLHARDLPTLIKLLQQQPDITGPGG